jgi:RNA polymerase subunit RPABC4/transcription elongation factor Spt4
MALIKCKDCGKEISKQAKTCPQCGRKKKNIPWEIFKFCFGMIFFIILFVLAASALGI